MDEVSLYQNQTKFITSAALYSFEMNSYFHVHGYFMFLLVAYLHITAIDAIEVGDNVCMTGYIMDIFSIKISCMSMRSHMHKKFHLQQ